MSELFEIHITGDESIKKLGKALGHKVIEIGAMNTKKQIMYTEVMTSIQQKFENFKECLTFVKHLSLFYKGIRSKIECPATYNHYLPKAIYTECHFKTTETTLPISKNVDKDYLVATDRVYKQEEFAPFIKKYKGSEVELCLYDSLPIKDFSWFKYWPDILNKSHQHYIKLLESYNK